MSTTIQDAVFESSDEVVKDDRPAGSQVSPEENEYLNNIFKNAKKVTTEDVKKKPKVYFTLGRGSMVFSIDGTTLDLSVKTQLTGKGTLEERYYKQLEEVVFGGEKEIDPNSLVSILMLVDLLIKQKYPIQIRSGKYKTNVNKIVAVLNKFFNENFSVLEGMYKMFNETITNPPIQPKE